MKSLGSLFHHGRCHGMLKSLVLGSSNFCHMYSTEHSAGDTVHEIGEKARSTAEEFTRRAQAKKESIKESAQGVLETAKDAALRDTQADKEKFKERVEKGNYGKIGRD